MSQTVSKLEHVRGETPSQGSLMACRVAAHSNSCSKWRFVRHGLFRSLLVLFASLPAGTYALSLGTRNENAAASGDLDISQDLTITGAGAATTIVNGSALNRLFHDPTG